MVQALAFNSIIVATSACKGKRNRPAVAPPDNFFTQVPFLNFCKKMQKMKIDCPLPYEEVLEDIIKTGWTEQCGHLEELRCLGKAALVCPL